MYLVLLETSGNQNFIFSTNKMRENVGASELIHKSCSEFVTDELGEHCELLLNTSGKAYVKTDSEDAAKGLIGRVTLKCLHEAPGLDIAGAYVEWKPGEIHTAIQLVHEKPAVNKASIPTSAARFQRIPIVEPCAFSGLPAYMTKNIGRDKYPLSRPSCVKRKSADNAFKRMKEAFGYEFPKDLEELPTKEGEWLAVVHADGNGLGSVFLDFENRSGAIDDDAGYLVKLKAFSEALDEAAKEACRKALDVTKKGEIAYALPLVFGGDDLTAI